jgi:hypothetical protein
VHGHLVAVEVRVERGTDERMDPDRLSFHEHRLEGLDPQPVKRRSPVQQDRMVFDDVLEDLVDLRIVTLDDLLGPLDRLGLTPLLQLVDDEGLEQLDGHGLRKTTLMQVQLGADYDDRAARVVDALSEQVLTEPTLLALEHVRERLERPLPAPADRLGAAPVIEQGVDSLLQHPLLVAQDDLGRPHVDQLLEPVVAIDHPPVEVVQVRGGEPATVERNEGPQVRRNHRNDIQDHPVRPVPAVRSVTRVAE